MKQPWNYISNKTMKPSVHKMYLNVRGGILPRSVAI